MHIKINKGSRWQRKHAKNFAIWFGDKYLKGVAEDIDLQINIVPYLEDGPFVGECECLYNVKSPRDFVINVVGGDGVCNRDFIMGLAHEMVHVKQYALNEMRDDCERELTFFRRKAYSSNMEYWDQPWEIEAYGMERGLLHRYAEHAGFYQDVIKHGYD